VPPARINALALQNGNQLIAGINAPGGIFVVRYNVATGQRDNTFGTDGLGIFDPFTSATIGKILIQPDNKILGIGTRFESPSFTAILKLRQFDENGNADISYGQGSIAEFSLLGGGNTGIDGLLQADGQAVVLLNGGVLQNSSFALVRINTEGNQDTTFGLSGTVSVFPTIPGGEVSAAEFLQDPQGDLVVVGTEGGPSESSAFLRKYSTQGLPVFDFGEGGVVTTDFGAGMGFHNGSSIALSGSDKVVIGGFTFDGSEVDMGLARYSSGGMVSIESIDTIVEDWKITPNPISNQAEIQGFVNQAEVFDLRVFDQKGALVQTLWTGHYLAAGHFSQLLDFSNLSSGVYFIQLEGKMGQSLQTLVKK
ncbi:MAG: T9SS type A sorting domain-containing protein, partial [Bacteroidota bacterium]